MPYLFGGLVVVNAAALGYYLFLQQPTSTETLKAAQDEITQEAKGPQQQAGHVSARLSDAFRQQREQRKRRDSGGAN